MQVRDFIKHLKNGDRPPLTLILGEEQALREQAQQAIASMIPEDQKAMNFGRYDMHQTPVGVALDDATSMPFFGDYREVVIDAPYFLTGEKSTDKIDHDLAGLQAYFENPVPSTMMVLVAPYKKLDERKRLTKALKKSALIVDAAPLDERAARMALAQIFKQHKVSIEAPALDTLVQRTNGQYSIMMGEVRKLLTYASDGSPLTVAAVSALVPKQLNDRVFDLVTDVLRKHAADALALYRDLLAQREEPIRLNSLMLGQFRLLLQVKLLAQKGYGQGNIATTLKAHPYRVKLALRQVDRLPYQQLAQAYSGLVDTETAMKTGTIDKELAFELFMLKYTGQSSAGHRGNQRQSVR
ncbi:MULTISPECIES: DNA polymerase III subunit delta [Lacticaseibacillus]|uniref:DNA polymerase III subunit delta n=2 Tax=Lacticaseibacillus TaxID=2759736 RepID=A0AAN1C8D7_LACCA|nr:MULTISPECIES: DNA polymerase III subunit delta [Lacticaseibacillus]ARY91420.1 DNA polymerase III subunit delta [Lacticaseibacillus casei]KAB1968526.1 DNA polymerase III subunit delta [Lacticaseibacillus casei]WLV82036.1 DNA polymerase III subunit delta [Lacticaseibacillus sp. NCIMB 15473]WNX25942.1 DNA polymerase III subunit delta [Lacticaseibacillus casei]WNX28715.1 DNA polymerase III subunit delta [Lacticaseibacillus casei]